MPVPGITFLYIPCVDVDVMRTFYSDLIGMDEIFYSSKERMLAYNCDGLQFTIMETDEAAVVANEWSRQPGWVGGTGTVASWSVSLTEDSYGDVVERLKQAGATALHGKPAWVGYWSFPVRDPMGNTVEVTFAPPEMPKSTDWCYVST